MTGPLRAWAAQNTGIETHASHQPVIQALDRLKKNIAVSTDFDYGWVKEDGRKGKWTESLTTIGYTGDSRFSPYLETDFWNRLGINDYTVAVGNYFKFKDRSYWNTEIGFGPDASYLYSFQAQLEYQRPLVRTLFWQVGARYSDYSDNGTYLIYPGLTYYFGDNDISIVYNQTVIEGRGPGSSGTVRGHFVLNDRVSIYAGGAVGAWLFDIDGLSAADEFGYIGFSGFNVKLTSWLTARIGYSYSAEKPSFIKRSVEAGLSAKF